MIEKPHLVQAMLDNIDNNGKRVTPVELAENAIFFVLASITGAIRGAKIVSESNGKTTAINHFGISLLDTGGGKNFALSQSYKLFEFIISNFPKNTRTRFHQGMHNEHGVCMYQEEDLEYYELPSSMFVPLDGTREGFQKLMQGMAQLEGTSLNMIEDEIGDIITNTEMLSRVKSAWDDGDGKGKTTVSGKYFAVTGVPVNMMMFGSPHSIRKSKHKSDKFDDVLIEGFLRRSFTYYQSHLPIERNRNYGKLPKQRVDEIAAIAQEFSDYIIAHKSDTILVHLSREAEDMLDEYAWGLAEESNKDPNNMFKRATASAEEKVKRLAGLIAVSDFSSTVEPRHMKYAIDFSERTNDMAEKSITKVPIYVQIFNKAKGVMTARTDIMSDVPDINGVRSFEENLELAEEYADKCNHALIRHEAGKVKAYMFEPLNTVHEDEIVVSVSTDLAHGFEPKKGKWLDIGELLKKKINYSAGTFNEGHRNKENYKGSQDLIILDIDEGMSLNLAKSFFGHWKCCIATTKSHQKEKNGKVCDRYRVVLLPNLKVELESEKYSEFMGNVVEHLGVPADMACRDASRFYYGYEGADVWFSEGTERFDIRPYIPETKKQKEMQDRNKNIGDVRGVERYFLKEIHVGSRSNGLFRYAMMLSDSGLDNEAVKDKVFGLNSMLDEPLDEKEIQSTIFKSLK